jgi:hypothetical protein
MSNMRVKKGKKKGRKARMSNSDYLALMEKICLRDAGRAIIRGEIYRLK